MKVGSVSAIRRALTADLRERLDALARLTSTAVGTPIGLISIVGSDGQHFAGAVGLPEPWQSSRETPLSHSFCRHVVAREGEVVIDDSRTEPLVAGNLAISDLGVIAYAGVPLRAVGGAVIGSVCAIDAEPRRWTPADLAILRDAASLARADLRLREIDEHAILGLGRVSHDDGEADETTTGLRVINRMFDDLIGTAEQARASQVRRARTISHELKTPLIAAKMLCEDLADESDAAGVRTLERISGCAQEAMDVLDAQVAAAQSSWRSAERHERVDVQSLFEALHGMMQPMAGPDVSLRCDAPAPGAAYLQTDGVRVGQVLRNLLANALRVTTTGQVRLSVHRDGETVRFTVADTGPGIEGDAIRAIFAEGVSGDRPGSFGLGLPLSRAMMRELGGDLTVTSTPGRGARFEATLREAAVAAD